MAIAMTEDSGDVRARIVVNDSDFLLADSRAVDKLKADIREAIARGGGFVDFTPAGGSLVSVLVSTATHIVIAVEEAHVADLPDDPEPYSGVYDLL
ncbi:hypothetical protein [Microbacterium sp. p3-SID336]|uniref:hypothetical protein n=1 Tax=Microbacterium sp. p3-SID336 TaxID=2916212 RepID=UPI0021A404DF|nr:hypothetical protein [Microbacterium sp. p3-SID336]MCT1478635.1 hypothetical protein [Microbacterium sp. p3-SID336]